MQNHLRADMRDDTFEEALKDVSLMMYWAGTSPSELRNMYHLCVRRLCFFQRDVEVMGEGKILPDNHVDLEQYRPWFEWRHTTVSVLLKTANKKK
jgi:hypothetical protein